ncbi:uncharacterized protein M421DRAFT_101453 [Didymella exigua CBS 183.55]|uniref:Zinc finger PHD-type domain-containing protein n=1 Tax=Didymella exigua CBS 183.55 TaxID=1150837 RepID=A0A6A5RLX3_9PLEO|nr:uncharacterized protein M421DRAFT_101453 [Didymella exigua CBS 183.55]KAF1928108.1 hypothetical protein M421DRAFT_101453 [Didymella exigua CBS 183.55]
MVNSLLFRWEDSQALQHHCGFCERPLSHPGARASCFGTHSEPCHRFHQAMFMRNRAHICNYCGTIDEAHYKRHHDLLVQLRSIYESCGESDWTIVPVEPGDPRRGQMVNGETGNLSPTPEDTSISKRERKDAKCLARAANRTKFVTQEEIRYVDSVLHPSEDVANSDGASPANTEEMQLIEEHLRYNANVYNSQSSRKALRQFAKIPDVDVDFESEVERVLDTFRITELVKRNLRNRGLQGKELKTFENLVDAFRNAVVEDLVLLKKDMMEVRMRRAGYLRYTNKAAYNIVEDRYNEKDWKTGERIISSASESSGFSSPFEELVSSPSEVIDSSNPILKTTSSPDRRHLQHVHTRISGDDGLGQRVIEPYHAPLLPLTPNAAPKKPPILHLKVVESKENRVPAGMANRGWLRRDVARQIPFDQPSSVPEDDGLSPSRPRVKSTTAGTSRTPLKPVWDKTTSIGSPGQLARRIDEVHFPSLNLTAENPRFPSIPLDALAVQPPREDFTTSLRGPERLITPIEDTDGGHPAVSQKKAKKTQRETKRKAKKIESPEEISRPTAEEEASFGQAVRDPCKESPTSSSDQDDSNLADEMSPQSFGDPVVELNDGGKDDVSIVAIAEQVVVNTSTSPSITSIPHTTHGKHDHWIRFVRAFTVDQLTVPLLQSFEGCSHGSSCRFESHDVPDCPFHEPHCSCVDPVLDQCHLMYPGRQPCTAGPYNRAQGRRLMAMYEQQDLTKGRVMLVDDDLVPYFLDLNTLQNKPKLGSMPPRLLREHTEFLDGYDRGPLIKQEIEFERLFAKNMAFKHGLTTKMLQGIQQQNDNVKGSVQLCYCRTAVMPKVSEIKKEFGNGFVSCMYRKCEFGGIFHKRCVKKLGVEKVSRWYCTACEKKMKVTSQMKRRELRRRWLHG